MCACVCVCVRACMCLCCTCVQRAEQRHHQSPCSSKITLDPYDELPGGGRARSPGPGAGTLSRTRAGTLRRTTWPHALRGLGFAGLSQDDSSQWSVWSSGLGLWLPPSPRAPRHMQPRGRVRTPRGAPPTRVRRPQACPGPGSLLAVSPCHPVKLPTEPETHSRPFHR